MSTPVTYNTIRRLVADLTSETGVKRRRDYSMRLKDQLSDEYVLKKLVLEATPERSNWPEEDSITARKCRALSSMWVSVFQAVINMVRTNSTNSKVRLIMEDVRLPLDLLGAYEKASVIMKDPSVAIPLLPKKSVRNILKYILEFLAMDGTCSVHLDLLKALERLCDGEEFLGFFQYHHDYEKIISELIQFLDPDIGTRNGDLFQAAAKVLRALTKTSRALGIQMHLFANGILGIVTKYYSSCLQDTERSFGSQHEVHSYLYCTVADIIYQHPDYCLAAMTRFGTRLMRYALKIYASGSSVVKEGLNKFFLSYLFLSQFAGMLQGRVAGHMGDLGKSSLVPRTLGHLLSHVMDDITKSFSDLDNGSASSKSQTHTGDTLRSPSERQRVTMELAARLLAASQQEFLCKAQWDDTEDVMTALMSTLKVRGPRPDEWIDQDIIVPPACAPSTFLQSPWARFILLPLAGHVDWQTFLTKHQTMNPRVSESHAERGLWQILSSESSPCENPFPILDEVNKNVPIDTSRQWMTALSLICSCAELFPSGICWSSDFFNDVEGFRPDDHIREEVVAPGTCTVDDISTLIFLLAAYLDQQGGPAGRKQVQLRILTALCALTDVTNLFYGHYLERDVSLTKLASSWQLVWQTLFRSDLQYTDHTKDTSPSSSGEIVLVLIRRIIQFKCTDPSLLNPQASYDNVASFIYRNQDPVWNLPAFRSVTDVASVETFELISWLCHNFGLSDSRFDQIDYVASLNFLNRRDHAMDLTSIQSRRRRLLLFCFGVIDRCLEDTQEQGPALIRGATLAATTLMKGKIPFFAVRVASATKNDSNLPTENDLVSPADASHSENLGFLDACLLELWQDDRSISDTVGVSTIVDPVSLMAAQYREGILRRIVLKAPRSMDFVPEAEAMNLNGLGRAWANGRTSLRRQESSSLDDDDEGPLLSLEQVLALKVLFSCELCDVKSSNLSFLDDVGQRLVTFIGDLSQLVDADALTMICRHLLLVARTLLRALSMDLSDINLFRSRFDVAADICRSILSEYTARLSDGGPAASEKDSSNARSKRSNDALFEDSDDDVGRDQLRLVRPNPTKSSTSRSDDNFSSSDEDSSQSRRRKRKGHTPLEEAKRRKFSENERRHCNLRDYLCAEIVGQLLMTIEPSVSNSALVCRTLLGCDFDLDPSDVKGDVDLRLAKAALSVLTSPFSLFHDLAKERLSNSRDMPEDSSATLFCRVLELVRVNMTPSSPHTLLGYHDVASIFSAKLGMLRPSLRKKEVSQLIDCMNFSHDIGNKPSSRAERLRASTQSFAAVSDDFRCFWDKHFPLIVKNSMTDSDYAVRRLSRIGLSIALSWMDEKKVLNAVTKLIPPISELLEAGERLKSFDEWYKTSCSFQMMDELSGTLSADLLEVMELESLQCRAAIASSVKDVQLFHDCIYELAMIPVARPDLEIPVFSALTKVAHARKYDSIEAMIETESAGLLFRWTKSRRTSLPLLVTAPKALRRKIVVMGGRSVNEKEGYEDSLEGDALLIFLRQRLHLVVPFCVFETASKVPIVVMEKENREAALSMLLQNETLRFVASVLVGTDDSAQGDIEEAVESMMKKSVSDIRAFCYSMHQSSDERHLLAADRVLMILYSVLTEEVVTTLSARKIHVISRRIIDLTAISEVVPSLLPPNDLPFQSAILAAIEDLRGSSDSSGDTLRNIGNNTVGSLIRSFARLERASTQSQQLACFSPIVLQAKLISAQNGDVEEKIAASAFCIHLLTEALLKPSLESIRPRALDLVKEQLDGLLNCLNDGSFREEVAPVIKRLVAAAYHLHENCQKEILEHHDAMEEHTRQALCRSRGLCHWFRDSNSRSSGSLRQVSAGASLSTSRNNPTILALSSVRLDVQRTLAGTFGMLKWAFDHSGTILSDALAFVPITSPFPIPLLDLERLRTINESFAIQTLAMRHESIQLRPSAASLVKELSLRVRTRQSSMAIEVENVQPRSILYGESTSIDQKLVLALLLHIEHHLKDEANYPDIDHEALLRSLSLICGGPYPKKVKVVASRCLAKVNASVIFDYFKTNSASPDSLSLWFQKARDPSVFFHTQTLLALSSTLKSPAAVVALVAFETLEAILSTDQGRLALRKLPSSDVSKAQLGLITSLYKKTHPSVVLSTMELNAIFRRVGIFEDSRTRPDWCWDSRLWLGFEGGRVPFEEWIRALTTALIVTCTVTQNEENEIRRDENGEFFWLCQRMCSLDHSIASKIFPFLVLYLLDLSDEEVNFNGFLTDSFHMILRKSSTGSSYTEGRGSGRKALLLIVDTIDLLRRVSQSRFSSREHSRNLMRISERESPKAKGHESDYNAGIPDCPKWCGVPYGVVMRLDGLTVAEACIHLRRNASALFFLELFMNARFGKVGELFDQFSEGSTDSLSMDRANEISGSQQSQSTMTLIEGEEDSILRTLSVASSSYKFMGEDDAHEAVTIQSGTVKFHAFGWDVRLSSQGRRDPSGLLRSLNTVSHFQTRREVALVADSMESLEFHTLLRSFIDGLVADSRSVQSMDRLEAEVLVEKWHEEDLRRTLWDSLASQSVGDSTIPGERDIETRSAIVILQRNLGLPIGGYFGAMAGALDSFRKDDFDSCCNYLLEGRINAISEISRLGGLESSVSGIASVVEKLRALELFEEVFVPEGTFAKQLSRSMQIRNFESNLGLMLHSFQETASTSEFDGMDRPLLFVWLKEVCLSTAYAKKRLACAPGRQDLLEVLMAHMCISAVHARELGRPFVAAEAIQRLHALLKDSGAVSEINDDDSRNKILLLRLEESKILESQGDFKGAIKKSQQIVELLSKREPLSRGLQHVLTDAQLCCGTWLTKYKLRHASSVLDSYLQPAARRAQLLLETSRNGDDARNADKVAQANMAIGQIVSGLYSALVVRVQSSEWRTSSSTRHLKSELARCEPLLHEADTTRKRAKKNSKQQDSLNKKWEELFIYCEHLRKDLQRTEEERQNVIDSMHRYLRLAVESYAAALALASTPTVEDLFQPVSQLMSLWFDNSSWEEQTEEGINLLMDRAFEKIPTFRLVTFSNQLFSRIEKTDETSRGDRFQIVLQNLVYRMCSDHPYHCLLPLLSLANGTKVGAGVSGRHVKDYLENVGNSKVDPANSIISRLEKEAAPYLAELLGGYIRLTDGYIDLAGADTSSFHKKMTKNISFSTVTSRGSAPLDKCLGRQVGKGSFSPAIFTSPPHLQPNAQYHESDGSLIGGESITGFRSTFDITETGLHRPKIVVCYGSNGGEYRQLVKGEDEIRQDAIMSQVFKVVNSLMARRRPESDRKTGPRSLYHPLRMATYNVIPLSPASGVLEWVENTTAFGDIIFGRFAKTADVGLHAKYYPKEWNYLLCRKHFAGSPESQKLTTYEVVCRHFSPCFRFFFVEQFGHDMMKWHSARMRYIRSVAVSSMVGHILGIGDRHTSNILVHTQTGEVVQIDFGIVFEQGKLLHTPERVPFRLTRNMVDGMGPCGTEGTFVRSSEQTMSVLRKNASTLLTILSAVVADPLYKWSVSPVEGMRRQKVGSDEEDSSNHLNVRVDDGGGERSESGDDDKNEMGKKAIARINDKLQGYEESTSGEQQGVEGQVQLLINSARDVENLSRMYVGWGPYI